MHKKTLLGREGEALIERYLGNLGFTLLEKNYSRRYGEVDLIAANKTTIIFVEVKMRTQAMFDLSEVITLAKQKKIITVAKDYLAFHDHDMKACRFDVALVDSSAKNPITYIEDAFREL